MAYIPPALRTKQEVVSDPDKVEASLAVVQSERRSSKTHRTSTLHDIQKFYWPTPVIVELAPGRAHVEEPQGLRDESLQGSANTGRLSIEDEVHDQHDQDQHDSLSYVKTVHTNYTLNASEAEPDKLKYVLIFNDANPRWEKERIIYVKSNLHILPAPPVQSTTGNTDLDSTTDSTTESEQRSTKPEETESQSLVSRIAVFDQMSGPFGGHGPKATLDFVGYFNLIRMEVLEPNTPELVRMLEQKWTRTNKRGHSRQVNREAASWKKSLQYTWAVLQFSEDPKTTAELGPPDSPHHDDIRGKENVSSKPQKSVSEMLKEMRLKDGKDAG